MISLMTLVKDFARDTLLSCESCRGRDGFEREMSSLADLVSDLSTPLSTMTMSGCYSLDDELLIRELSSF